MMTIEKLENGREVTIDMEEYKALLHDSIILQQLYKALEQGAKLSWTGDKLAFDSDGFEQILKVEKPRWYEEKMTALKKEKEDGTDKD